MASKETKVLAWVVLTTCGAGAYVWYDMNRSEPVSNSVQVTITGHAKSALSFGAWTVDGVYLRSPMTLSANPVPYTPSSIRYSAFDGSGVKLDDGEVDRPSLRPGETGRASVLLRDSSATRRVTVEVE